MRRALFLVIVVAAIVYGDTVNNVVLIGTGTIGPYQLGQKNLLYESEQVTYRGALLKNNSDYHINYGEGYLVFIKPIPINDTIRVSFSIIHLELKPEYNLMRPIAASAQDSFSYPQITNQSRAENSQLNLVGSQRFIVNIGNNGEPSLSQSLDLNITGQLANQVSVKGSISDRNFDNISGSTSSLDELDKILLHLDAPNVQADFGDLELAGISSSLLDFRRKLTGIDLQANKSNYSGALEFAFSPGQQVESYFFGIDGFQGPYFINSSNSSQLTNTTANRFLAGTEEIYLDGNKLMRGVENDYTIDYNQGYIEFTPKNVISSRNRITIKIQAADENYRRTFLHGKAFAQKGFDLGVQYIREGDDKSRPRTFDIGQPQYDIMNKAGANEDSAFLSGATNVGVGMGDYNLRIDSLGDTLYLYVGPDSGSYQVSFSFLGQGKGSYQYGGGGKYVFVGGGNGSYAPLIYYPLPQLCEYGSLIIRRDGPLFINSELAISYLDRNTISAFDSKLAGIGFNGLFGVRMNDKPLLKKTWNGNLVEIKFRKLESDFRYPGSINPVEFSRQYNLPEYSTAIAGQLTELKSSAKTGGGDYYEFGGGQVTQDSLNANRGYGRVGYVITDGLMIIGESDIARAKNTNIKSRGRWDKYETGAKFIESKLRPSLYIRHELKTSIDTLTAGFKADEFETGFGWDISRGLSSSSRLIFRNQDYGAPNKTFWREQYDQYQIEQQLQFNNDGLSFETNLARFYQNASYPDIEKIARNIGSLKINYSVSPLNLTFYENVNGTARVLQTREYVYVGKGKGDYRRDGNDYVAEPGGEYIEIVRQSTDQTTGISGYQISGGMRVRYDGASSESGKFSGLSYENDLSYQQNLYPQIGLTIARLFPLGKFDSDKLSYRNYDYRQRLKYRINKRSDYVSYSISASQNMGSQYQFENLESRLLENSIETKISGTKDISLLFAGKLAQDRQILYSGKVDINRTRLAVMPDFQLANNIRISNLFDIMREKEKIKEIIVTTYTIGPKLVGTIINIVRIECEVGYSSVNLDKSNQTIPYVLADNKKPGNNYNLIINGRFKLNRYGNMTLSYNYKKLGDGYSNYNFRAEARAEF